MRSGAIGLVLERPTRLLGVEPFFMELIGGVEEAFHGHGLSVLLRVVSSRDEELEAYRRWAESGIADAVIVANLTDADPRPALLARLGLPSVVVGPGAGDVTTSVVSDEDAPAQEATRRLLGLGHRRIARVSGPAALLHTRRRTEAMATACQAAGIEPVVVEGDYSERSGRLLTQRLLSVDEPPTAIIYDNDVMALGGLSGAQAMHVAVPERLSLVAWDDSTACRLSNPPLTVMAVDVHQYGVRVGEAVLDALAGNPVTVRHAPQAHWVTRGSTAPAPEGESVTHRI